MTCAICRRGPLRGVPRRAHGVLVCATCYGQSVIIRTAAIELLGARTFYVGSLSHPLAPEAYVVKRFKTRLRYHTTCNCPDYTHRGQVLGWQCKHVRLVTLLAKAAHGFSKVPHGATFKFKLADKEARRV